MKPKFQSKKKLDDTKRTSTATKNCGIFVDKFPTIKVYFLWEVQIHVSE